jgi:DNA-binding CsgD family transcriptional regulator
MVAGNNFVAFHESAGDPAVARKAAQQFVDRAAELGLGVWERSFRMAVSNLDFHAGDYPAVLAAADELLDQPLEARTREALLEQVCLALVDLGRIDEALRRIDAEPDRPGDWTWHRQVLWVRSEAALWGGRPQDALAAAEEILTGPEGDLNVVFAHVTRAWARWELDLDPGPPLTAEYPAMLAAVPDEVLGVCLLHHGADGEAVAAFDRAAERWSVYHRRGELRCRWAAGEAARRAGHSDAVERLVAAEGRLQELEMVPLLNRVHRSLRAAGLRRAAPRTRDSATLLTGRERQVLALVAQGLTNGEIAARLGVSRHTVVTQIGSASLKLGATGRAHAATLAARAGVA